VGDDLAASDANRSYSLAATSIAIFTFMLVFLCPRFASGGVNALRFQATLVVMGVATFSFVFSSLYNYGPSLGGGRIDGAARARHARRGDRLWLLGQTLAGRHHAVLLAQPGVWRCRGGSSLRDDCR
jgi:hypothetical protein